MKNIAQLFLSVFLILLLSIGCKNNRPVKIGLLLHALDKERWESDKTFFVNKVQELGGSVLVEIADNDADKQLAQAKKLLNEGVKAMVVIPVDQFKAEKIVTAASEKNVKVISYDRLILNCNLDYYVSTDNVEIGEMQSGYLTKVKPIGNYALIGGAQNDHNSQFLYLGQMNILQPLVEKGDITIIYNEFTESWEKEEGYKHTLNIVGMNDKKIDVIIAGNDAIALGVIQALEESNLEGKVLVAGMDADLLNLREIVKGTQSLTVYKPIKKLAATAAEIAVKLANSEECEKTFQTVSNGEILVPSVLHKAMLVNKENLQLTVISEGYQKEEEIFK